MLKVTGLDEFQRKLNDMARQAESLSGNHSVPVPDLLTPDFLRRCSRFQSAEEMFEVSGFNVESAEDFAAIPDAEWDEFPDQYVVPVVGGNAGGSRGRVGSAAAGVLGDRQS